MLNSNMVASLRPNVSHGPQLERCFCYDLRAPCSEPQQRRVAFCAPSAGCRYRYSRPNCLGEALAAEHALAYTSRFVRAHAARPWAAFVSLIDAHEDSMAHAGVVDAPLASFLSGAATPADGLGLLDRRVAERTVTLLLSDHGLHYGPTLLTPAGQRERARPLLSVHIPPAMRAARGLPDHDAANAGALVTPFDVHATLLELLRASGPAPPASLSPRLGRSLLRPLPPRSCEQAGVPARFCLVSGPSASGRNSHDLGARSSRPTLTRV